MPLKVLIVDDNEASAQTMGWMMEVFGHEIRLAHNGQDAFTQALDFLPAVIFLDIGLPGMNGYEVCRRMRAMPELKNVMIVAQTGWAQEEHHRLSQEAGFDLHLVKPVDMQALQGVLSSIETQS